MSYVVAVFCFRLRLIVSLYSADGWLEERPHTPGGGESNRTTSRMGTCPQNYGIRLTPSFFTTKVDSLLLHHFLEQYFACVALSAVEGVYVSGGRGSFRLPKINYGISSVYNPTLHLWAVLVLVAKLSNQGETYGLLPLQLDSCSIFVACIRVVSECQRWKRDEVVAQQWGMFYVVQVYVHQSVARGKDYGTATVTCNRGCSPVRET